MDEKMTCEDWLRGCVHHDGKHGYVTLPCDEVLKIADFIERLRAECKTEPMKIVIPKAHGRKQALLMIDEIMALVDRMDKPSDYGKPNNCETCSHWWKSEDVCLLDDCHYEPMDEPNDCETCRYKNHNWWSNKCDPCCRGNSNYEPMTESQIRCPKCGRTDYIKNLEKDFGVKDDTFKYKCINCNTYIKDESQTEGASDDN